ncbi:D-alanine-D-alanine ligase [Alkalibacterium putridalgicola]|uniref:D-alanine-D-alanine ligase n=1 Tax=Alkalibacterium putridalgicola TaxID=426703 RepID=A0A1H7TEE4_9LACT|nr:hypothetical protein [Alkalibacterium putridalgicola]GEK89441.1 hypothetical protein APU01nite_14800 [Alkalibacterium putridalgicola]SEL83252.1 D-alanine-D-alanine ligase [Alkalibacterium putridalgicola]
MVENRTSALKKIEKEEADFESREGLKSKLLEEAAYRRGYKAERLGFDTMILTLHGKELLFRDMNGPLSSAAMMRIVDDKYRARQLIKRQGVTVPESTYLRIYERDEIKAFAHKVGYPVVLKPNDLSRGEGVYTNIASDEELDEHLDKIAGLIGSEFSKILIEKQFNGDDYRFFVVDGKVLAASKRSRANVTGDGEHTVLELIEEKNRLRKQNRDLKEFLIPTDKDKLERLYREGRTLETVPEKGEYIVIRDESNIASGGDGIDYTDTAHEAFKEIAVKAIQSIPGFHYGGVDIITNDITLDPKAGDYVVTEVEFSPGPMSMFHWKGEQRDMANPVLDFYLKNLDKL